MNKVSIKRVLSNLYKNFEPSTKGKYFLQDLKDLDSKKITLKEDNNLLFEDFVYTKLVFGKVTIFKQKDKYAILVYPFVEIYEDGSFKELGKTFKFKTTNQLDVLNKGSILNNYRQEIVYKVSKEMVGEDVTEAINKIISNTEPLFEHVDIKMDEYKLYYPLNEDQIIEAAKVNFVML